MRRIVDRVVRRAYCVHVLCDVRVQQSWACVVCVVDHVWRIAYCVLLFVTSVARQIWASVGVYFMAFRFHSQSSKGGQLCEVYECWLSVAAARYDHWTDPTKKGKTTICRAPNK